MLRNLVTSLFKYEHLETTDAKAKMVRPLAEKMITLAKSGDLHARRQALAIMNDKAITHRLFEQLEDRYSDRHGGYVRIIKKGNRKGDGAPISVIQLLPEDEGKKKGKKKRKAAATASSTESKGKKETKVKEKEKADPRDDRTKEEKGEEKVLSSTKKKDSA
jgi:large subunit ribosomal protein L17